MTEQRSISGEINTRRAAGPRSQWFRASTAAKDRHGTVVQPEGIDTARFSRNPVLLWAHDGYGSAFGGKPSIDSIIGKISKIEKSSLALDVEAEFAPAEVNVKAEQAYRLVRAGFLSAISIGFIARRSHMERLNGDAAPTEVLDEIELLEISLVPVPSNPEALAIMRSIAAAALPQGLPSMAAVADAIRQGLDVALADIRRGAAIAAAVRRGAEAGIRRQKFAGSTRRQFHMRGDNENTQEGGAGSAGRAAR